MSGRPGRSGPPVSWTPIMLATLRTMRGERQPIEACADKIGVSERVAGRKARELGLNQRHNKGRRPGWATTASTKEPPHAD